MMFGNNPFYIIELDQKLRRNRKEAATAREYNNNDPVKYRARIASVAAMEKEAEKSIVARTAKIRSYLGYGYTRQDISQMLGIHPYIVDAEISKIEREEKERDRIFPSWNRKSGGYFCITPGLPTRR